MIGFDRKRRIPYYFPSRLTYPSNDFYDNDDDDETTLDKSIFIVYFFISIKNIQFIIIPIFLQNNIRHTVTINILHDSLRTKLKLNTYKKYPCLQERR